MKLPGLRPRPILLLAIAGLAAMTCDDGQPAVSLAEQIGQAFCAHQFACCSPIEITALATDRYTTEEDCVAFATLAAREQLGTVDGAVAQGRIAIDPARASACVAAYRNRACSGPQSFTQDLGPLPHVADVLALCPDLLVGHVPDGAACDLSQECMRGSRCVVGTPPVVSPGPSGAGGMTGTSLTRNPGVCVRYQELGEPCNTSADCDPAAALACRTPEFACRPRPREGEPCTVQFDPAGTELDDCAPTGHLFCDLVSSVCRRYPRENESCSQFKFPPCDPDPALGLSCISFSNQCKRPGNEGDPCGGPALPPCRADLACHPTQSDGIGTCASLPVAGAGCTDRCASPAVCLGGTCTIPGAATIGTSCVVFTDCDSLSCTDVTEGTPVCTQLVGLVPVCVGAAVSPGLPVNISGVGGIGGTVGTGAAGGSVMGAGGRAGGPPTGTAGAGGVGGTGIPPLGCQASDFPIGDPLIADFTIDSMGTFPIGGTFTYPGPGGPIAMISNGAWHITATTVGMMSAQYWGVGIYFNGNALGTDCVDATAHTGVQFDISGSIDGPGCTAQYATSDSAHTSNLDDPKGSGDVSAYAPQADLTVTSTPTPVMMPFAGPGAPTGGSPAIPIDKAKLTSVQWQFTTAPGAGNSCIVDITIDNVMFF